MYPHQRPLRQLCHQETACRLCLEHLIPLPPETKAEDINPLPGGLAQMYPYAEDVASEILRGVVEGPAEGKCLLGVLSATDCCGLFIHIEEDKFIVR